MTRQWPTNLSRHISTSCLGNIERGSERAQNWHSAGSSEIAFSTARLRLHRVRLISVRQPGHVAVSSLSRESASRCDRQLAHIRWPLVHYTDTQTMWQTGTDRQTWVSQEVSQTAGMHNITQLWRFQHYWKRRRTAIVGTLHKHTENVFCTLEYMVKNQQWTENRTTTQSTAVSSDMHQTSDVWDRNTENVNSKMRSAILM